MTTTTKSRPLSIASAVCPKCFDPAPAPNPYAKFPTLKQHNARIQRALAAGVTEFRCGLCGSMWSPKSS